MNLLYFNQINNAVNFQKRYAMTTGIKETIYCEDGFYIGDPCYALDDALYDEWLKWADERKKTEGSWRSEGKFVFDGNDIMISDHTKYGDGFYDGCVVDSGNIAVIPLGYCDSKKDYHDYGSVIDNYTGKVTLHTDENGDFYIRWGKWDSETIHTGGETLQRRKNMQWRRRRISTKRE